MNFVPHTEKDKKEMLDVIGISSAQELFRSVPEHLKNVKLNIPEGLSEFSALRHLKALSEKNKIPKLSFVGAGAYEHFVPAAIEQLLLRGEFFTAYTPYQAEASQGTLQAIFEYQTLTCELTAMDVCNASLYDGASALAEAVLLSHHATGRKKIVLAGAIHPYYLQAVKSYTKGLRLKIETVAFDGKKGTVEIDELKKHVDENTACVVLQTPNFFGCVEKCVADVKNATQNSGALFVACVNPVSLGVFAAPGDYGADIACGEGQPLGIPLSYGGPYLGFFACKEKWLRRMPGRVAGQTVDTQGRRAFCLTLQTREQHIRREKATSNICTNQGLLSLAACMYLCYLGKQGIRELAKLNVAKSHYAKEKLCELKNVEAAFSSPFFNEFVLHVPSGKKVFKKLLKKNIAAGFRLEEFYTQLKDHILVCVTETKTKVDIDEFVNEMKGSLEP